jgi:ribosomal protein S11
MALQNPNNLYTGGAVVFNTQPSTNFAIQLMAQKKAKDEALDEYYRKLPSTINEAGMRDQDRPGFMQRVSEMQQFYLQNRDAIKDPRRDGGAAQYNFEKLFRGVKGYTEESKTAAKTALELGKLRLNKDFSYVFDDPQTVERIAAHDLPIGTEGRADLDLHTLTIPPQPLGVADWQRIDNTLTQDLVPGQTPTGKTETLPNFQVRKHFVKQFDPQSLSTIGARAVSLVGTDRNIRGAANGRFAQATPEEIALLNKVYEPLMKRPIQSPADLFAAERIVAHSQATPGYRDEDDKAAYAKYSSGLSLANSKELALWKKKNGISEGNTIVMGGGQGQGNALDAMADKDHGNFAVKGGWFYKKDGNPYSGKVFIRGGDVPATVKGAVKSIGLDPDYLVGGVEATVENGVITSISNQLIGTINRGDMEGVLQPKMDTEPAKGRKLQFGGRGTQPAAPKGETLADKMRKNKPKK